MVRSRCHHPNTRVLFEAGYAPVLFLIRGLPLVAEVLIDQGSLGKELDRRHFFSRPKVAFDSVGGHSAARLADALAEGGRIVVYGCSSGKAPQWQWQQWVFRRIRAEGFNLRR